MKNIYFWMLTLLCSTLMFSGTNNFTFETQTKGWSMFQTRAFGPDTAFKYDGNFNHVFYANTSATLAEPYCTPEGTNSARYINNFSTTGGSTNITNEASGFSTGGYGDFSSMSVTQGLGGSVNFSADIVGGTAGFRIWVDWNQDGQFDTTNEVAYKSNSYKDTHTGSFSVPAGALAGSTTMRIVSHWLSTDASVDPCAFAFTYGEFEDYTFNVSGEASWDCPSMEANIGDSCDDGDAGTIGSTVQEDCSCASGIPIATNDEACTATTLTCGDAITQSLIGATESMEDTCYGDGTADVWFSFTSDGSQIVTVAETSTLDVVVQLFVGDDCGNLTEAGACKDFPENYTVTEAGTYYFKVRPYYEAGNEGTITVELTCVDFECPTQQANIGDSCDDGNPNTVNDVINENCECEGTAIATNDECEDAISLTVNSDLNCGITTEGTTLGATASPQPDDVTGTPNNDVWFTFVATANSHNVSLSNVVAVVGSSVDMGMGIYDLTASSCELPLLVGDSDPNTVTVSGLTVGNTYLVRVYGWSSSPTTTAQTTFDICIGTPPPPPAYSNCSGAIALECNGEDVTYSSGGSLAVAPSGCTIGKNGIWFSFMGTGGDITINSSATFDHKMSMQTGSCDELTWIACMDDSYGAESYTIESTVANQMYYVYVAHYSSSSTTTGDITIGIECATPPACEAPTMTAYASDSVGEPIEGCLEFGEEYYVYATLSGGEGNTSYNVTANAGEPVEVDANDSAVLGPFTAGSNVNLMAVGAQDDDCSVSATVTSPALCAPSNDDCVDAEALVCGETITGSTVGATASGLSATCSGFTSSSALDLFYSFEADGVSDYTVSLDAATGNSFDGILFIYSGACGELTSLGCSDSGNPEEMTLEAPDAGIYYVRIFRYSGSGEFTLGLNCIAPPACEAPTMTAYVSDATGEPIEGCLELGSEYYVYATLSGGEGNTSYNVTANAGEPVEVDANDSAIFGPFTLGTNVSLEAVGIQDAQCGASASVDSPSVCPPSNNDCMDATALACGDSISGSTYGATESGMGSPSCATGTPADVFYTIDAVPNMNYTVSVQGDDYDGVLAIYTGTCGDLTELDCADAGFSAGVMETIEFSVNEPTMIYVRTYDWSSSRGDFTISLACEEVTTCTSPLGMSVNDVTESSANISWTPANDGDNMWEISLTTGGQAAADGLISQIQGTPSHMATGLNPETQYSVYLRTICSEQESSEWEYNGDFTTLTAVQEPCIAPSLSLEVVSNTDGAPIGDCIETEEVFYVSATLVGGSGNANYVVSANGGETTNLEADTSHLFGPFNAGTDVEITATGIDDASCTAAETVLSPDICIATPCDSPLGIVVDNITESTADITWSPANDGDNMWEISLTTGGQGADDGMIDTVSGTPMYSASGLNSSTTYRVYLRTICADVTSEWAYNGEFTTDEAAPLYECPSLQANIGDSCDDGDETTENDLVNEDCECMGTPIVVDPEECVAPTEVTIERLSPTSIAISTNVEVWSMYVDIFNNPPSFNSRTKSHWTKLRNTYINNNLVPNRTYYLWFRTNCPNNEVSEYTELYTVEPWAVARSSSNPNATINQVHEQLVNVDVFPNPTSDELNISGINAQQIRIFDSNGTAIFNGRVINNQLNLRQLQTGVYRMVITDENNREHAVQVIKR